MFQPEWALTGRRDVWSPQDDAEQAEQLERLKHEMSEDNCVAFIGAGPSTDAEYPSWRELAEHLAHKAGVAAPQEAAWGDRAGLKGRGVRQFAQQCRTRLGEEAYHEFLKKEFHPAGKRQFADIHSYLATMPFNALITTNFDPCLEEAGRPIFGEALRVRRYPDLPISDLRRPGPPCVFHIHGQAYENAHNPEARVPRVDSLVLTESDYERAYMENVSPITPLLQEVLLNYTAVFIGVGFDDPALLDALELSRQRSAYLKEEHIRCETSYRDRTHFGFLPMVLRESKQSSGEPERDLDRERLEAETWPTERRISVVRYQRDDTIGYTKLTNILQHLCDATQPRSVGKLSDDWAYARRMS